LIARSGAGNIVHQLIDVFELTQGRPTLVPPAPTRSRTQPHSECFGEVFCRMRLRVPRGQMQYKLSALRFWLVEVGIGLRKRTEEFTVLSFEVQSKCGIERMTRFMSQYAHGLSIGAAFYFEHLLPLEFHQAWMGQVKRNGDTGNTVRREPLFCEPHVRFEPNATSVEFAVETLDVWLQERAFDFYREIADAEV